MSQMSRDMKDGMWIAVIMAIVIPLFLVVFGVPALLLDALVVTKLWNWFIMEPFHTIKMHYALGLGISILVGFLARTLVYKPKEMAHNEIWATLSFLYLGPLLTLLTGYIVHHWV